MAMFDNLKRARETRRSQRLDAISKKLIQAREFNGKLYLCYGDQPLIEADGLGCPLVTALTKARNVWKQYQEENL